MLRTCLEGAYRTLLSARFVCSRSVVILHIPLQESSLSVRQTSGTSSTSIQCLASAEGILKSQIENTLVSKLLHIPMHRTMLQHKRSTRRNQQQNQMMK